MNRLCFLSPVNYSRFLLGLIVASASCSLLAVEIDAKVYGKVNVAYDWRDASDDDWTNYVSRIGVKGAYAINDHLEVIYQLEQQIDPVHGGKDIDTLFSTRNSFIGLKGKFGTVFFGAHDTPFKKVQQKIDVFNDQGGDIKSLFSGEVRAKDSYGYHSPKWGGWKFSTLFVPSDSNFDSSKSVAVSYKADAWSFSFGLDDDMRKNDKSVEKTKVYDAYRGSVLYKPGNWQFGLMLQRSEQQNLVGADMQSAYVVSVRYTMGDFRLLAQHGNSDIVGDDVKSSNLGVEYFLQKNTKLYLYYWKFDKLEVLDAVSLGVEYKF